MGSALPPTTPEPAAPPGTRPRLVIFYSPLSGRCRRVDGFVAQMLQRRKNHETFDLVRVDIEERPDLAARFRVDTVPTLIVVEERKVRRRIVGPRSGLVLEEELADWLR